MISAHVPPEASSDFLRRFEAPTEDEGAVIYNGNPASIRSMIQ